MKRFEAITKSEGEIGIYTPFDCVNSQNEAQESAGFVIAFRFCLFIF